MVTEINQYQPTALELAKRIHHVIQSMPVERRNEANERIRCLLLTMPNPQVVGEIMSILESGFQAIERRD
jgi:hypothetical protein